ncbi:MAG: GTP cyclohydrolase I [Deltaproteobacteria bacterium]|nr:GTP cyclohydrolase I [Deltaproteobacteria bacterium]
MARTKRVDRKRAEAAVRELIRAFGLDLGSPELRGTPGRVARAWADLLLAGYRHDPEPALGESYRTRGRGAVVACRIPFFSMCPHHLLPSSGEVHVAFAPQGRVPGFGKLSALVDVLAHRLVLQEDLTQSIADAIFSRLAPTAVAVVVEARHFCVVVTDPARAGTLFRTSATAGDATRSAGLLKEIDSALGRDLAAKPPARARRSPR